MAFPGFHEETTNQVHIPEQFFRLLLPNIDNLDELKLSIYIMWRFDRMDGPFHYLHLSELNHDNALLRSLDSDPERSTKKLQNALKRALKRGTLLQGNLALGGSTEKIICLNSPKGRVMLEAIKRGEWQGADRLQGGLDATQQVNIFQLYEAHIGPLTPMIADVLRDAEKTYQAAWITDAFRIAVEKNIRNWHYIEAILRRWQEEGRNDRKGQQARRSAQKAR